MTLNNMRSAEWRACAAARLRKGLLGLRRVEVEKCPVFIAGKQRSGTTMLMNIFHLHPDTHVFNAAAQSSVFLAYRIRSLETLKQSIGASRYPFPCYKIICDSHILPTFLQEFPDAKVIWMYREPAANAESSLRKWPHATAAMRLVCDGKPGGGWFAEGVSEPVKQTLRALDRSHFTDFDYACLTWWVHNQLYFEFQLEAMEQVRLLQYESLVANPGETMRDLFEWLGMTWSAPSLRFVHSRSAKKPDLPAIDDQVKHLCDELFAQLNHIHGRQWRR